MISSFLRLEPARSSVAVLTLSLILSGCLESNGNASSDSDAQGLSPGEGSSQVLVGQQVSSGAAATITVGAENATAAEEAFLGDNILIINNASGRALDAAENKNGGNIQIMADSGFSNQRWSIEKVGDAFSIRSMQNDNRSLYTWASGSTSGTNIALYDNYGTDSQLYNIEDAGSGWYLVKPVVAPNQCLDAYGVSDESNVGTWSCHGRENQQWTFKKESTANGIEGNDIVITSRSSGKVLDVAGNDQGSNIRVYTDYQAENQRWNISSVGSNMYKIITSQDGNKAVDTWAHGTTDGTNIALWEYTPSGNKHFYIEEVDTGWFRIKPSIATTKCLVAYSEEGDFDVGIWECDDRANMQWGFNRSVVDTDTDNTDGENEEERPEPAPEPEPEIEPRQYRDPPYYGSIFISTVNDIVTSADPTAFVRITYQGIEQRRTFDRRPDRWQDAWFYLYDAVYENGRRIEFQVNYEFSRSDADEESRYYAIEVGRMPNVLRRDLDTVTIHDGVELWGGGSRNLLIHTGQSRLYAADGIIEETLIHEATHASLDDRYETTDGWIRAQQIDNMFITNYARDYSTREDVAESYLLYLAIRHKPERISSSLERTIRDTMPARIRYFDSLGLDVYPFE